jgi:hypothetical protein
MRVLQQFALEHGERAQLELFKLALREVSRPARKSKSNTLRSAAGVAGVLGVLLVVAAANYVGYVIGRDPFSRVTDPFSSYVRTSGPGRATLSAVDESDSSTPRVASAPMQEPRQHDEVRYALRRLIEASRLLEGSPDIDKRLGTAASLCRDPRPTADGRLLPGRGALCGARRVALLQIERALASLAVNATPWRAQESIGSALGTLAFAMREGRDPWRDPLDTQVAGERTRLFLARVELENAWVALQDEAHPVVPPDETTAIMGLDE